MSEIQQSNDITDDLLMMVQELCFKQSSNQNNH